MNGSAHFYILWPLISTVPQMSSTFNKLTLNLLGVTLFYFELLFQDVLSTTPTKKQVPF